MCGPRNVIVQSAAAEPASSQAAPSADRASDATLRCGRIIYDQFNEGCDGDLGQKLMFFRIIDDGLPIYSREQPQLVASKIIHQDIYVFDQVRDYLL
jgi:hypothetical protein